MSTKTIWVERLNIYVYLLFLKTLNPTMCFILWASCIKYQFDYEVESCWWGVCTSLHMTDDMAHDAAKHHGPLQWKNRAAKKKSECGPKPGLKPFANLPHSNHFHLTVLERALFPPQKKHKLASPQREQHNIIMKWERPSRINHLERMTTFSEKQIG